MPSRPVARRLALPLDDAAQVDQRLRDLVEGGRRPGQQVEPGRGERLELVALLVRDAEQLADRQRRDGRGEVADEVDLLARRLELGHRVEAALDDRGDPRARRESRRPVNSGVSRCRSRVCSGGSVNPSPPGFCPEPMPARADEVAEVGGQPAGAPEDLAGLLVPGHQPGLHAERQREVAHRVVLAVLPQRGHRVEAVTAQRHERVVGDEAHRVQAAATAPGEVLPGDEARHPGAHCRHPTREGVARRPAGAHGDHVPTLPYRPSCPSGRVQGRTYG